MPEGDRHATEEEMRQAIGETLAKTDSESTDPEAVEEPGTSEEVELKSTEEEELFAVRKVKSGVFRQCCRFAALAVVLSAASLHPQDSGRSRDLR